MTCRQTGLDFQNEIFHHFFNLKMVKECELLMNLMIHDSIHQKDAQNAKLNLFILPQIRKIHKI